MTETAAPKRTRGWNKREVPRVNVMVRFEPDQLAAIDLARGEVSRQEYLAGAAMDLAAGRLVRQDPPGA